MNNRPRPPAISGRSNKIWFSRKLSVADGDVHSYCETVPGRIVSKAASEHPTHRFAGITAGYADPRFAGPHSGARLFGPFTVSVLHNLVHLLSGVLAAPRPRPRDDRLRVATTALDRSCGHYPEPEIQGH
ncbi:DUF4383 domain-containing protein [Amycolatopsis sp. WQ 127309]|uniref:DUF4383 domain-containing protein n=1 Tax=Amycolatopsis sp. WQ 127309 TaxID=2932773 RepID=UPI0035301EFA